MNCPQRAPKEKRPIGLWILLVVTILVVVAFISWIASEEKAVDAASPPRTLTYELLGNGKAAVTYIGSRGVVVQEVGSTLPWSKQVNLDGFGIGTLTGTLDQNGGDVTCRIKDDAGTAITETKSTGAFASCIASTPLTRNHTAVMRKPVGARNLDHLMRPADIRRRDR
jgi:hypothetical protein